MRQVDFEKRGIGAAYGPQAPDQWIAELTRSLPTGAREVESALEIGCGPAQYSRALLKAFTGARVLGLELSSEMIRAARETAPLPSPSLARGHALACPIRDQAVDFVLMRYLVHHVSDTRTLLGESHRILRQGGVLVVETTDPNFLADWNAELYSRYPRIAEFDLPRWPSLDELTKTARDVGFSSAAIVPIQVDKGWRDLKETVDANRERARTGIGTSFWQLLTEKERWEFHEWEASRLERQSVDGKIPYIWYSSLLVLTS